MATYTQPSHWIQPTELGFSWVTLVACGFAHAMLQPGSGELFAFAAPQSGSGEKQKCRKAVVAAGS